MKEGSVTMPAAPMWDSVGPSAAVRERCTTACVASQRLAPTSSICSTCSRPARCTPQLTLCLGFLLLLTLD